MIFILILINLLAQSLPKFKTSISNLFLYRLTSIGLILSALLVFNVTDVKSIGSGISLFSGFTLINLSNQYIEILIYIFSALILVSILISSLSIVKGEKNTTKNFFQSLNLSSNTSSSNLYTLNSNKINWLNYYPLIVLFNVLGASFLISSFDFLLTYIALELQSFSLYILASLNKDSVLSTSAGLKYFLIGGFASCLILLGISLIYSSTGTSQFESISILINNSLLWSENTLFNYNLWIISGFVLLLIGFLIKLGAAPFHQWSPDVYDQVPTKVTTWLVLIPKLSLFLVVFEIISIVSSSANIPLFDINTVEPLYHSINARMNDFSFMDLKGTIANIPYYLFGNTDLLIFETNTFIKNFLVLTSLVSLIIGSLLGLSQIRIKRLLAFSAISHIGFLLLSLSIYNEIAIEAFFFYLFQYVLTNLNVFAILILLSHNLNNNKENNTQSLDINYLSELKGIFEKNPILSLSFAISFFSMAGVPPLIGFFAKQQVLFASISSNFVFLSIIAILTSVISAYYYLKIIKLSNFDTYSILKKNYNSNYNFSDITYKNIFNNVNSSNVEENTVVINNTNVISFLISFITLVLLLFIVKPDFLLNSAHILALNLFYI